MNIKRVMAFFLATLLLLSITACDSKKKADIGNTASKGSLKIYYTDYEIRITPALEIFKKKYTDVKVEENYFSDTEEYKNKIIMDILSGQGPDVIILRPKLFNSINRLSSNGVFCDLNELIKKDSAFKMADYNENIMNAFEEDGKRFIIPLRYSVNELITSKEVLQRNNIKIDPSNWAYKDFLQIVEKYMAENKGKGKYFFADGFGISDLIKGSGKSFVDYRNKKSMYSSDDFIELLEIYKKLYPSICPKEKMESQAISEILKNNTYIMGADSYACPTNLLAYYSLYKSIGQEMEVYPFPTLDGDKSTQLSYTEEAIAINSQSENKETALNFIKTVLSEENQRVEKSSGSYGFNTRWAVPVNKKAYEDDFEYAKSNKKNGNSTYVVSGEYRYDLVPLPESYKPKLDGILSVVKKCQIPETEIDKIIEDKMPDFLSGRKTAAQTAKEIDDKVNLYLNE